MIWLGWRQVRLTAAGVAALAIAATVFFVLAGLYCRNAFNGVGHCVGAPSRDQACQSVINTFLDKVAVERAGGTGSDALTIALGLVPGLLGAFLGAPLLPREYEQGTHRLAWTQTVSRRRWLTTRLLFTAGVAVVGQTVLSLVMTYQRGPINHVFGRIYPGSFNYEGLVPIGYALFAVALGIWLGALIRRTVPSMAATLIVFEIVKYLVQHKLRPHYQQPLYIFRTMHRDSPAEFTGWLFNSDTGAYQPNSRFWTFQLIEFGIFAALSIVLIALIYRAISATRSQHDPAHPIAWLRARTAH